MNDTMDIRVVGIENAPQGMAFVWREAPTPSYIVDEARLTKNLEILARDRKSVV